MEFQIFMHKLHLHLGPNQMLIEGHRPPIFWRKESFFYVQSEYIGRRACSQKSEAKQILLSKFLCNSIFPSSFLMKLWFNYDEQVRHIQELYYGPIANLLFYCHIFIHWEKVTSQKNLCLNFTLEVQIVWWKYQNTEK